MENKDSEILPAEDAHDLPCDFNELVSHMESNTLADSLSVYLDTCKPFSVADLEPSNNFDEPNINTLNALVDPFDSIVLTESSEPRDNDGKGNGRFGNKINEIKRSSTRKSTRKIPSNQKPKIDTQLAARKSQRTSRKKPMLDLLAADVRRRRRSDLVQRTIPSTWGLGGKLDEIFNKYVENDHMESRKGRAVRRGVQKNNGIVNQNSQGESRALNNGLLLKLKLGTKAIQTCQLNTIPDMDKDFESYREVRIEDNYVKELPTASVSRVSNENSDKGVLADTERIEDLGGKSGSETNELVENICSDPGTSPDSEVINVTPETQISGTTAEGLHEVRVLSKDCISHQSGDCGVGSGIPSPEIDNEVLLCDKFDHGEKQVEGSWSSGASMSITTGVASMEPPASTDMLTIESGMKTNLTIVGIESMESKSNGQYLQKSSKSSGITKNMSTPKKKTNYRQKGTQAKSTSKGKVKERSGNDVANCDTETHHPFTGGHETNGIRGLEEASRSTGGALSNSAMVPSEEESRQGSPRSAWVCCDDCHKWRRISAILADSIELTECRWICKDNMDKTFADCSIPQEKSNADINEELELSEASCEEDASNARLNNSSQARQKQLIDPPSLSWKLIKTNMFQHRNRKNQAIDEIMVCHCKPPLDGRMGCRDECLNRMLNIECVKGTCPCGEFCSNQQFQKRKYSKLKCFPCGKKGFGLQSQEDIPKGRFLIEYVGEVLDMHAYEARQREYAQKGHKHFYFMTLNGSEVIDACAKGNLGRFINHSCEPNCRTEKWMVNGEVCIGLFALRDIKLGEELTFDYNYVRVFGAAAKKCVCGSSRCRGVIGGDALDAEEVVGDSDDEYPEPEPVPVPVPVTYYESRSIKLNNIIPEITTFSNPTTQTAESTLKNNNSVIDKFTVAVENNDSAIPESFVVVDDKTDDSAVPIESATSASESKTEHTEELLPFSVQPLDTSFKANDAKSEISSSDRRLLEKDTKGSLLVSDSKKKPKSQTNLKKCTILKPQSRSKLPSSSSTAKRGKSKAHGIKPPEIESKPRVVPQKPIRLIEDALTGRFEAVQEALTILLNADGGISKRRDGWKGYLKLLYLTAHGGKGEGIQSNRDLSMILDALLKTKSRTVLHDIINKNGLQMLHNLMKRYRKEFNKIPILRKLLKVLEFLAEMKILTLENILKPSPNGAESFKESILSFTEHADKQVHQMARNFRDRYIPWSERKVNRVDRDMKRIEHQSSSNFRNFRHSSDRDYRRFPEASNNHINLPPGAPTLASTPPLETTRTIEASSTSSLSTSTDPTRTRTRKRKSRWDEAGDINSPSNKQPKTEQVNNVVQTNDDDMDHDAPPGFSSPINRQLMSSSNSTETHGSKKSVMGYPKERYNSRLPTAFGITCSLLKKIGLPKTASAESWVVAPATTFHPFPPLPAYPRQPWGHNRNSAQFNQHQPNFQRFRNPNTLGRRYYKQQKWNNHSNHNNNNPRYGHPWNPNKYGPPAGFMGPNQQNGYYHHQHHQPPPPHH